METETQANPTSGRAFAAVMLILFIAVLIYAFGWILTGIVLALALFGLLFLALDRKWKVE